MGRANQLQIDTVGRSRDVTAPDPTFVGSLKCERDPRKREIALPHRLSSVYLEFKTECFCLKGWRRNTNIHRFTAQDGLGGLTVKQRREVPEESYALGEIQFKTSRFPCPLFGIGRLMWHVKPVQIQMGESK